MGEVLEGVNVPSPLPSRINTVPEATSFVTAMSRLVPASKNPTATDKGTVPTGKIVVFDGMAVKPPSPFGSPNNTVTLLLPLLGTTMSG